MADIIELTVPAKPAKRTQPKIYSVDVTQYPDNLLFTVSDIKVSAESLSSIADALEKIAQIIRTDIITGIVSPRSS